MSFLLHCPNTFRDKTVNIQVYSTEYSHKIPLYLLYKYYFLLKPVWVSGWVFIRTGEGSRSELNQTRGFSPQVFFPRFFCLHVRRFFTISSEILSFFQLIKFIRIQTCNTLLRMRYGMYYTLLYTNITIHRPMYRIGIYFVRYDHEACLWCATSGVSSPNTVSTSKRMPLE